MFFYIYLNNQQYNLDYEFNQGHVYTPQIISEDKINQLKEYYAKKKGYTEHNPQTLMNFIDEFRSFQKVLKRFFTF